MSNKHNTDHSKQNAQDARNAEGVRANFDKAGDQTAEHGKQFADAARERLAEQSKQNIEAVTRCSTVLSQAFQDASRSLFDLGQQQFQRTLEGLNKLTRAKSVQEFAAIQSDLVREGLQHMVQDSKAITDTSARAASSANEEPPAEGLIAAGCLRSRLGGVVGRQGRKEAGRGRQGDRGRDAHAAR